MTIDFNTIKGDFQELRDFFLNDLDILIKAPKGGNYAALLLIMTACEVLGPHRYGTNKSNEDFFKNYLLPEVWQPVGGSLYEALRHGLAHMYMIKTIVQIKGIPKIELGISWSEKPHLKYDKRNSILYINIQELSKELKKAFAKYETELQTQPKLCERYNTEKKKSKNTNTPVQDPKEQKAWQELILSNSIIL